MFYLILIFVLIFQGAVSYFAPSFPGVTPPSGQLESAAVNTTSELIASGINPLETFIQIMTFQLQGSLAISLIFIVQDIVLAIMAIRMIRGND